MLFLANAPRVLGGVETAVATLHRRLDRTRFDVDIILTGFGPFHEKLMAAGVRPLACECPGRYSWKWHRFLQAQLARVPYDVTYLTAPLPNVWTLRRAGSKVVGRLNYPRVKHGWYPMSIKSLDRFCSRFFDGYAVVSKAIRAQFIERGYDPAKLHLIYNGVRVPESATSTLRQELGIAPDRLVIGTIGRMRHEKGMDVFLRSAALIAAEQPRACFVIAGAGDQEGNLRALTETLGLRERVHFLGFRHDVANVLSGFDLLLYLSRWEAFSNTIIEAMALKVPVVATAVGGNVEAVEHGVTGILVEPENHVGAAAASLALLRDPAQRRQLGEAAHVRVRLFSEEEMVARHEALFLRLAEGGRSAAVAEGS